MAKIDITKIEGYETMTPEQKLAALEAFEYEDGSAEIERYKNAASKANSEAAEWKKKHNALLSDADKAKQASEQENAQLRAERDALLKEKTVGGYVTQLMAQGYEAELAQETAQAMADGDMAKVFANQTKFLATHDTKLKADILKGTPTPPAGGSDKMDAEKFAKLGYVERLKLHDENPSLYAELANPTK